MYSGKILHITPYYIEQFGYQDNYLPYYQKYLGCDVKIAASDYYPPFPDYDETMKPRLGGRFVGAGRYEDNGIEIIRCKSLFANLSSMAVIYFSVKGVIEEFNPDVVHIHCMTNMTCKQVLNLQKKYKYRVFIDSHSDNSNAPLNSFWRRLYYIMWKMYLKNINLENRASGFLPITEDAKVWLESRMGIRGNKVHISPLGVDMGTMFFSKKEGEQFKEKHKIADKRILVYAGKQSEKKKVDIVIDVFRNLLESYNRTDIALVLVGNSEKAYEDVLRYKLTGIEKHCIRLPFLPREELRGVYSAADIGLWLGAPSNTIQEAMACGTALVLPNNKIVGHLIKGNGYLADEINAVKIGGILDRTLADKEILEAMKERSIEIAHKYSWESIARELIEIYKS